MLEKVGQLLEILRVLARQRTPIVLVFDNILYSDSYECAAQILWIEYVTLRRSAITYSV